MKKYTSLGTLFFYFCSLLLPVFAQAATAHPSLEPCHTDGTLLTAGNWESTLESATQGAKYRLPAGTLTPSGGSIVPTVGTSEANRITIVPNCVSGTPVTTTIVGKIQLGAYLTLAGTYHTCTTEATNAGCISIRPPALDGTQWAESPIVRNVHVRATGTTANTAALRIDRDVRNPIISGDFDNQILATNTSTLYVNSNSLVPRSSQNIQIINSRIQQNVASTSGSGQCIQFASAGPTTPGDWSGPNNLIEGNVIENCKDGPVPGIDIKPAGASGSKLTIRKNTFNASTFTGACILIQNENSSTPEVIIEENTFNNCDDHSAIALGDYGTSGEYNSWRVTVQNNVFNFAGTSGWALINQFNNVKFYNNSIYRGEVRNGGGLFTPTSFDFRNNALSSSNLSNSAGKMTCTNNLFYNTTGDNFDGLCTSGQTGDPLFTNPAAGDLTLSSMSSPAVNNGTNVGLPCNGSSCTIGAFDPPRFNPTTGGEVGLLNAQTTILNFTVNTAPPILPATACTGFTRQEENPPATWNNLTITSCARQGTTQVKLVHATATGGRNQRVSYTPGNLTNSALIGNTLNQPRLTITNAAITNNVGAAPSSHVFSQNHFQIKRVPLAGGSLDPLLPVNIRGSVIPNGYVIPTAQITCTGAVCPETASKTQGSWDGTNWFTLGSIEAPGYLLTAEGNRILVSGGSGEALLASGSFNANNVGFVGLTEFSGSQYPAQGSTIPGCLNAAGLTATDQGALQRIPDAVPTFSLGAGSCLTMGAMLKVTAGVTNPPSILRIRWVDQTGTPFTGTYVPAEIEVTDSLIGGF